MLVALLVLLVWGGAARGQSVDAEDAFQARIAEERQRRGLPSLAGAEDLVAVARRHAQRMADSGEAHHNPNLTSEVSGWSMLGENVGEGFDVEEIHGALMASQTHRDVMLHTELTQVGVGVVTTEGGHLWVVQVYRRPAEASSASAEPSAPAPSASATPSPPTATTSPARPAGAAPASVLAVTLPGNTAPVPPPVLPLAPASPAAPAGEVRDESWTRPLRRGLADPVAVVDVRALTEHVPGAARLAALLLAAVVGMHGVVLRRLGLLA